MLKAFRKAAGTFCAMLAMLALLAPGAFAAGTGTDTLPDGVTPCSITIHKYVVDNMPMDGENLCNGTFIDTSLLPDGAEPLGGVSFKLTKVKIKDNSAELTPANTVTDTDSPYSNTQVTASSGMASFSGLKQGIYLVEEVENPIITAYCDPFVVQVPFTEPSQGDHLIYDAHVYPKNTIEAEPEIEKSVTQYGNRHDSVGVAGTEKQVGDDGTATGMSQRLAHFIESPQLPSDIGACQHFSVTDKIDSRLEYIAGQEVKVTGVPINEETGKVTLTSPVDFLVTEPSLANEMTLTVDFTQEGRQKLAGIVPGNKVPQKARADIEFDCKLIESEGTKSENQGVKIPNTCDLHYTNSLGQSSDHHSNEVEVHTGGVSIKKVDLATGQVALADAEFMIFTTEEDARNQQNAVKNPETGEDYVVRTNNDGIAAFYGLPYGNTGEAYDDASLTKNYWIVETKAPKMPDGTYYELYKDPIKVTVSKVSHQIADAIIVKDGKGPGIVETGLMDSQVLSLAGTVLVVIAAGAVVLCRRRKGSF